MQEPTLSCPHCHTEIRLTESLAAPLIASVKHEHQLQLQQKEFEFQKREAQIIEQQQLLAKSKASIEEQVAEKLKTQRAAIAQEESVKARTLLANDIEQKGKQLAELTEVLKDRDTKLIVAQKAQADILRKERELADARRELDLTLEKKLQESQAAILAKAKQEAVGELGLKVQEKELTIQTMQKQIEELRRRAEQGSQQLQGEVQELELETMLRTSFPHDTILPVAKGEFGGDALQKVNTTFGQSCGQILWESKRTKVWSDGWLAKLRDDQRAAKAELAIIITQALPKQIETFGQVDGVWVTSPLYAIPLASTLRHILMEVMAVRKTGEGQQSKMEILYQYLTGPRFRHRVEAIVEKFTDMQTDLEKERKMMTRIWAKREEQIRGVIDSTAGMYGDMQGIAGRALQEIQGLEMDVEIDEVKLVKTDTSENQNSVDNPPTILNRIDLFQ